MAEEWFMAPGTKNAPRIGSRAHEQLELTQHSGIPMQADGLFSLSLLLLLSYCNSQVLTSICAT